MLGCFVLASCVNDEEGPCLSDGKAQVLFSLVLQDNAQTRADGDPETWGDFENPEPGVGYDNQIKLDEVQVLLFKGNAYLGKLTDLFYTQPDPDKSVYQYIGTAPLVDNEILTEGDYKFVVLANSTAIIPESLGDRNFANLAFNYLGEGELPNIPMWGTTTTHLKPTAGTRDDIGPISLLRAVSKVTVKLAGKPEDLKGYSLTSVTVKNYNKSGYVLPSGYAGVTSTADLVIDEENTMHVNDGDKDTTDAGKVFAATTGTNEITFYLPEYDNVSTGATPSVLSVKLTNETSGGEFVADINFCDYYKETTENATKGTPVKGSAYNIIRNHHYQFNIFKVTERSLYVLPTVLPWNLGDEFTYKTDVSAFYSTGQQYLRWDTDGNLDDWRGSYVAVTHEWEDESQVPGRTPLIILRTTSSEPMYMQLDNEYLEFVKQNTDGTFEELGVGKRMEIPSGVNITTKFFVRPVSAYDTAAEPLPSREAHMSLVSNGPAPARVPLRGSMPGYAEGVDEIWFYWVGPTDYKEYPNGTGPGGASSKFEN